MPTIPERHLYFKKNSIAGIKNPNAILATRFNFGFFSRVVAHFLSVFVIKVDDRKISIVCQ
jgi:hypothetical protein